MVGSAAVQLAGLVGKSLDPAATSVRLEMCRSGRIPLRSCSCASEEVADCRVSEMVRRVEDRQQPDIAVALDTTAPPPYPPPRYILVTHDVLLEGSVLTAPVPTRNSSEAIAVSTLKR